MGTPQFGHTTPNPLSTITNQAAVLKNIGVPTVVLTLAGGAEEIDLGPVTGGDGLYAVRVEIGADDAGYAFGLFVLSDCDSGSGAVAIYGTALTNGALTVVAGDSAGDDEVGFSASVTAGRLTIDVGADAVAGDKVFITRLC